MTRLHKKCLIASSGLHAFLALLLVFGSAFFVANEKPITRSKLQFVPDDLIEAALAGGGGNPNIARTDDVQKGHMTAPKPVLPPKETAPPPRPVAKQEPKKVEPTPEPKVDPTKVKPAAKPVEEVKPSEKPVAKPRISVADLKPIGPTEAEKTKAKAEAEARDAARKAAQRERRKLLDQFDHAAGALQRGFQKGTKVEVGGPGGAAFADYGALVQAAYEDAWKILQDFNDDDAVAIVRVTIARSGQVVSSQISRRSGNATMDKSVQRALDKVRGEGLRPFPDFIKDAERTFTIEFNLKTKRLTG
jgi:TonB family protein